MKKFSLAELTHPKEYQIERAGEFSLTHYATSDIPNSLCFAENVNFALKADRNECVTAVITTPELKERIGRDKGLIVASNPKKLFFEIHNGLQQHYSYANKEPMIAASAVIHPTAIIKNGVTIGERTQIGAYSVIEEGTVIGDDVLIEHSVVIGGRGMHNTKIDGKFVHVIDLGNVVIGNRCEVLSHATIQKPYFHHSTTIGEETRISLYVNVGHGSSVGKRCLIAGHAILAGYCRLGNDVWIGPNSTISHMVNVADNAQVMLGSVVISDVPEGESVSGNFAYNHTRNAKQYTRNKR